LGRDLYVNVGKHLKKMGKSLSLHLGRDGRKTEVEAKKKHAKGKKTTTN